MLYQIQLTALQLLAIIIKHDYNGKIQYSDIEALNKGEKRYKYQAQLAKTNFVNAVVDAFYVQKFFCGFC